jgi:CBS domain-containing protein
VGRGGSSQYLQRRGLVVLHQHARRRPRGALMVSAASAQQQSSSARSSRLAAAWDDDGAGGGGRGSGTGGMAGRIARRALSSGPQQATHPAEEEEEGEGASSDSGSSGSGRRPNRKSKITAAQIVRQRQRKVCQLHSEATLEEAIKMLASNNSSCCMVYKGKDGQKEVVGIYSSRDIIKKLSKQGLNTLEALQSPIKEVRGGG